jgi:hypothetical protein
MEACEHIRYYYKREIATYKLVRVLKGLLKTQCWRSYHRIFVRAGNWDTRQHKNVIQKSLTSFICQLLQLNIKLVFNLSWTDFLIDSLTVTSIVWNV